MTAILFPAPFPHPSHDDPPVRLDRLPSHHGAQLDPENQLPDHMIVRVGCNAARSSGERCGADLERGGCNETINRNGCDAMAMDHETANDGDRYVKLAPTTRVAGTSSFELVPTTRVAVVVAATPSLLLRRRCCYAVVVARCCCYAAVVVVDTPSPLLQSRRPRCHCCYAVVVVAVAAMQSSLCKHIRK